MEPTKKILQTEIDRDFEIIIENCVRRVLDETADKYASKKQEVAPASDFCLIEEASKITGLSQSTIRTKCHHGEMPYFKPEGTKKLQFKRSELLIWIESSRVKSTCEMEQATNQYLISKRKKNGK